jgi:hypothetical protein
MPTTGTCALTTKRSRDELRPASDAPRPEHTGNRQIDAESVTIGRLFHPPPESAPQATQPDLQTGRPSLCAGED